MADKTPAKINEAERILDLVKKARPRPAFGPSAPPKAPAGAPSPKR
jgi:hypothetical protein